MRLSPVARWIQGWLNKCTNDVAGLLTFDLLPIVESIANHVAFVKLSVVSEIGAFGDQFFKRWISRSDQKNTSGGSVLRVWLVFCQQLWSHSLASEDRLFLAFFVSI